MAMLIERESAPVTRDQLSEICDVLGYDAADVKSIQIDANGPVVVEAFVRAPTAETKKGLRISVTGRSPYLTTRNIHPIASATTQEESR